MATSTEIIRKYIDDNLTELERIDIRNEDSYKSAIDGRSVDIIRMQTGEDIVVSYTDISITGTERNKPQIRVFMDRQRPVYEFARKRKMRYFLLTVFSKDMSMARNINHYDPHDYILAIETNVDNEGSRRDLRSLYDYLDEYIENNGDVDFLRCTKGQHQSGIYQGSFIKIRNAAGSTPNVLKEYLTYFDNRPYMTSRDEIVIKNDPIETEFPYNRIVFGAPGTGKSHRLEEDSKKFGKHMERVTFHPNYSFAQFVGTYKPVQGAGDTDIRYKYVPGPFMRVYSDAIKNPENNYLLLIEEINRANIAAVFGDVFQLLDRKDGISEYSIATSEDIRRYLLEVLYPNKKWDVCTDAEKEKCLSMRIPDNMFIWATMNSADQGVFPMDTAFKRRWEFEYLSVNDEKQVKAIENYYIPMCLENTYYVKWQELRDTINTILIGEDCKVNEDKLLGPFFISKNMLDDIAETKELRRKIESGEDTATDIKTVCDKEKAFIKAFESKVIMYLFEDVMKMRPQKIFVGHEKSKGQMIFSAICDAFEKDGEKIFGLDLKDANLND